MDEERFFALYKRRLAKNSESFMNEIRARDRAFVDRIERIRRMCELEESAGLEAQQHLTVPRMKKPVFSEHSVRQQDGPTLAPQSEAQHGSRVSRKKSVVPVSCGQREEQRKHA